MRSPGAAAGKPGMGGAMVERRKGQDGEALKMGRIGNRPYWVLSLSIVIRAMHLVGGAVILASALLSDLPAPPLFYMVLTFGSGSALLFTEWIRHRQICRELAGISTMIKALLLGAAYHGYLPLPATVFFVFLLASMASHAPKQVRHRLLF